MSEAAPSIQPRPTEIEVPASDVPEELDDVACKLAYFVSPEIVSVRRASREFVRVGAPPEHCLPPAVCYHRFRDLADQTLASGAVVTARGACFRYERGTTCAN